MNDINRAIKIIDGMKISNEKIKPYTRYNVHIDMALDMAISALEQQLTDAWIPVTERLPDRYERVHAHVTLKHIDGNHEFTAQMIWWFGKFQWKNGREISEKYKIIAWMPEHSPKPYKEVSIENTGNS